MAKKKGLNIRVPATGRTVNATIPFEMLDDLIGQLPEGPVRRQFEEARDTACTRRGTAGREGRLETPLSIESLSRVGWMLVGEHSRIAHGAIREGDFRHVDKPRHRNGGGWECGITGAFDRDPEGTVILRDAVQVGVFSEKHGVYLLLPPTTDRAAAIASAEALEREWRDALPTKVQDGVGWGPGPHYPEGAMSWRLPPPTAQGIDSMHDDEAIYRGEDRRHVSIYQCEAVLRPARRIDRETNRPETFGMRWCIGRRSGTHNVLSGPYNLVVGAVWAVYTNAKPTPSWHVNSQVFMQDPSDVQMMGVLDRESALEAARIMAVRHGFIDGTADDVTAAVAIAPLPQFNQDLPLAA